jgi:2-polyprenyl-3-methyl-5-hydroxy-6-metoxy-1,4-benzoquinol methylase
MIYSTKEELIKARVRATDKVLDVGFWGQGTSADNPKWIHSLLKKQASEGVVYGLDIDFPESQFSAPHYIKASAESFVLPEKVHIIFAGDIIEHLSNPGLFLQSCVDNLLPGGQVVITTPNAFNLFNLAEKITKDEPTVNKEHTCYYNKKTLGELVSRYPFEVSEVSYVYRLFTTHKESVKKKVLNVLYSLSTKFSEKFMETLVFVITKK